MDNHLDSEVDTSRQRSNGIKDKRSGARSSSMDSALDRANDENSPLLGNGPNAEPEWDGYREFDGMTWWQRPSVCPDQSLLLSVTN